MQQRDGWALAARLPPGQSPTEGLANSQPPVVARQSPMPLRLHDCNRKHNKRRRRERCSPIEPLATDRSTPAAAAAADASQTEGSPLTALTFVRAAAAAVGALIAQQCNAMDHE